MVKNTIGKYNIEELAVTFHYEGDDQYNGSLANTEICFFGKTDDGKFCMFLKYIAIENYPHRDSYHKNMYFGDVLTELSEDEIDNLKTIDLALRKFSDKIDIGNKYRQ